MQFSLFTQNNRGSELVWYHNLLDFGVLLDLKRDPGWQNQFRLITFQNLTTFHMFETFPVITHSIQKINIFCKNPSQVWWTSQNHSSRCGTGNKQDEASLTKLHKTEHTIPIIQYVIAEKISLNMKFTGNNSNISLEIKYAETL